MERGDPVQIAQVLLQIGVQEQQLLASFLQRVQFGSAHVKLVAAIQDAAKRGDRDNLRALIAALRQELARFDAVSRYAYQEDDLHRQDLAQLSFEQSLLQKEVAEAQQALLTESFGPAAKRRLAEFVLKAQQSVKTAAQAASFETVIGNAVLSLKQHARVQAGHLERERNVLNALERGDVTQLEQLKAIASAIQLDVMEEKSEAIEPLNGVVKKKIDVMSLLKETVARRRRISLADVQADLRSFTTSAEVTQYVTRLLRHAALLDSEALGLVSRYGQRAASRLQSRVETTEAERQRLERERNELAQKLQTDPLTGASNRAAFGVELASRIRVAELERKSLSFLIFDLDKFKQVNDKGGHAFGDLVLKHFAFVARTHVKPADFFARLGGEEFCLLVFGDAPVAFEIGERIRKAVGQEMLKVVAQQSAALENPLPFATVTVSVGVGTYVGAGLTLSEEEVARVANALYVAADKALYVSKQKRNRVTVGLVLNVKTAQDTKATA